MSDISARTGNAATIVMSLYVCVCVCERAGTYHLMQPQHRITVILFDAYGVFYKFHPQCSVALKYCNGTDMELFVSAFHFVLFGLV